MQVRILGTGKYDDQSKNYGDCILIDTDTDLIIYDCGSEEHAKEVIRYMDARKYNKAIFILSHNDSDHFDGLPYLLDHEKISTIYTTPLLKYVDEILERIDDGRKTRESIKRQIKETYDNIAQLSGAPIKDIYSDSFELPKVKIVGPSKDYMLDTVAKRLDGREGNTQDGETAVNATSIQVEVEITYQGKLLLTGDSAYEPLDSLLETGYKYIQLPHHGKQQQAEKIFEKTDPYSTTYIVSDNTGDSNGGSDNLDAKGKIVKNTKKEGNIYLKDTDQTSSSIWAPGCLGE